MDGWRDPWLGVMDVGGLDDGCGRVGVDAVDGVMRENFSGHFPALPEGRDFLPGKIVLPLNYVGNVDWIVHD
jgi:hypothetical protein